MAITAPDYNSFEYFLHQEYGKTPFKEEVAEAIKNWTSNYMIGLNPADFSGVSKFLNKEIKELVKYDISDTYMREMNQFLSQKTTQDGI